MIWNHKKSDTVLALEFKQKNGHRPVLQKLNLMLRRLLAFLTVLPLKFLWQNPYRCAPGEGRSKRLKTATHRQEGSFNALVMGEKIVSQEE